MNDDLDRSGHALNSEESTTRPQVRGILYDWNQGRNRPGDDRHAPAGRQRPDRFRPDSDSGSRGYTDRRAGGGNEFRRGDGPPSPRRRAGSGEASGGFSRPEREREPRVPQRVVERRQSNDGAAAQAPAPELPVQSPAPTTDKDVSGPEETTHDSTTSPAQAVSAVSSAPSASPSAPAANTESRRSGARTRVALKMPPVVRLPGGNRIRSDLVL